ncbi:creatinine amidohydrolase [Anaerotignum neopropionicum]|uniref:Creatinine amidohydrolase n=1 Tax=Anaerotignum neopropionicum TaxID=36847 RepID=A0A136WBX9_9FIRM|nr:creatininase family protein [Anaerotignum neopropionicum]KXL51990.1 creatinine amidohydrolase [Anaerotignum neopropionicum]
MTINLLIQCWEEIAKINMEKFTVFLGIAPVEEHGKHLPIGVDFFETNEWITGAIAQLERALPQHTWGTLPTIPLGFADIGNFPGNIHVSRELIFSVMYETINAIAKWGVKNIIVISGHADPLHTIAIEQAVEKINAENGVIALAPMGSIFHAAEKGIVGKYSAELTKKLEEFPNDYHAGWIETSCMLSIHPDYVKANYLERPNISLNGQDMMDSQRLAHTIAGEGHIGFPKEATVQLGAELNTDTAQKIKDATEKFILREGYECYLHHPLYHIPGMKIPG